MAKWSILCLYFCQGLLPFILGQQQRTAGPWRQRIQWENNGQVYSLMSTGSEYQAPIRSRSQPGVYVSTRRDGTRSQIPGATLARLRQAESRQLRSDQTVAGRAVRQHAPLTGRASRTRQQSSYEAATTGYPGVRHFKPEYTNTSAPGRRGVVSVDAASPHTRGGGPGPGAQHQELRAVAEAMSVSRQPTQSHRLISAQLPTPPTDYVSDEGNEEVMLNDDPRNPVKNHRNSVFYNMYPTSGRAVGRTRGPPGTGYGTRYFQNGKYHHQSLEFVIGLD